MAKRKPLDVRTLRWAKRHVNKLRREYEQVGLSERECACICIWLGLHKAERQARALKPAKRTKR